MVVLTAETCWALNKIIKYVASSWFLFTQLCRVVLQWINICILLHLLDFYLHWITMHGTASLKQIVVHFVCSNFISRPQLYFTQSRLFVSCGIYEFFHCNIMAIVKNWISVENLWLNLKFTEPHQVKNVNFWKLKPIETFIKNLF